MRIRKLELYGFKSFPDRTTLVFDRGISGVVGPNGCGKSNIVDAVKWCMGEQSAKSLRGADMLDVVFAGSADRAPVGFAEVSLTFTAADGEPFPGEYARHEELAITRRLHRNGSAEYLINGAKCRRRDIVELFLDTGVGNNLYSFIEQGSIGKIVHATPMERRSLIDEAAGIGRYKARREEAQQRLEATATQLDRAADVEQELGKRLRTLERQVLKAARFRRVRARIRQAEVILALARYADLAAERRTLRDDRRRLQGEVGGLERDIQRREIDLSSRREEIGVAEATANTLRDELAECEARDRELLGGQQFRERRVAELEQELSAIAAERESVRVAAVALEAEREGLAVARVAIDEELQRVRAEQLALEAAAGEAEGAAARADAAHRAAAEAEAKARAARERADAERSSAGEAVEGARHQRARIQADLAAGEQALVALGAAIEGERGGDEAARAALELAEAERARAREASQAAEAAASEAARGLRDADQVVDVARRELDLARRALSTLQSQRRAEVAAWTARADREAQATIERASQGAKVRFEAAARARSEELAQALARARAWLGAVEARARSARAGILDRLEAEEAAARSAEASALAAARADADARVDRARAEAQRGFDLESARLADAQARAEAEEREAAAAVSGAKARVAEAAQAVRDTQARVSALDDARRALRAGDSGRAALEAALPELPQLADLLDLSEVDPDRLAVLAPYLGVPVLLDDAMLATAAEAVAEAGTATVLVKAGGGGARGVAGQGIGAEIAAQILARHPVVASLDEARVRLRASGGASVVACSGERVGAEGLVQLGDGSAQGREIARVERELKAARGALPAMLEASDQARAHEQVAIDAQASARAAVERARNEARVFAQEGRRPVETATQRARSEAAEQLGAFEAAQAQQRRSREEVLRAARASADAASTAEVQVARGEIEAAEAEIRRALDALAVEAAEARELELQAARGAAQAVKERGLVAFEEALDASERERAEAVRAAEGLLEPALEAQVRLRRLADSAREAAQGARRALDACEAELERRRGEEAARSAARTARRASQDAAHRERGRLGIALADAETALERAIAGQEAATHRLTEAEAQRLATSELSARALQDRDEAGALAVEARARAASAASEAGRTAERAAGLTVAIEGAERRAAELATTGTRLDARAAAARSAHERVSAEWVEAAEARASLDEERATLGARLEEARARVTQLREASEGAESALRERMAAKETAGARLAQVEARLSEVQGGLESLLQRMEERYQLSLPGVLDRVDAKGTYLLETDPLARDELVIGAERVPGVPDLLVRPAHLTDLDGIADLVREVEGLRKESDALGEVHLAALEEYTDVAARHDDLVRQRTDLEESVAHIRAAIAKMNRMCRERFRDAFDRVNENFQELYPRLVGGGSARLALTDEEDLLETGVEIYVQPPGKRLQNLTLLSGGEKAMTAIAVLLSLFQVKPSPFCLLDEVDAPLDEGNGARFNDILREMSGLAQFILITHNRKTMECADVLYGVTMPTPGVSRLVSVRLGERSAGA